VALKVYKRFFEVMKCSVVTLTAVYLLGRFD